MGTDKLPSQSLVRLLSEGLRCRACLSSSILFLKIAYLGFLGSKTAVYREIALFVTFDFNPCHSSNSARRALLRTDGNFNNAINFMHSIPVFHCTTKG